MPVDKKFEEALFKLVKKGDEDTFEILFKLYYKNLCNYAVPFIKYPEIAEEIVQETFINIWEKRETLNIHDSWKAYIYRAVYNKCINFLKKSWKLKNHDQEIIEEIIYHQKIISQNLNPTILDKLVTEELAKSIKEALEQLPEKCSTIFLLSREENLTYLEIAKKLNLSINTVKTQMKRALKKLHEVIDKHLN